MPPSSDAGRLRRLAARNEPALAFSLAVLIVFFTLAADTFLTQRNITNVLGQAAFPLIAGVGVAIVVLAGEIDVSVGSLLGAVAVPLIVVMNETGSMGLGIAAALGFALVVGVVNGWLVAYARINSLIVTLGMLFVLRGLIYLYTGQRAIPDRVMLESFYQIGNGRLFGILPWPAVAGIVVLLFFVWVLKYRPFGRQVYAVGGNAEVARLAGYDVRKVKFLTFVISALLTAVAGILLSSRLGSAVHVTGIGFEFQVVAAVVLGGISLAGGIGTLWGVALGVLILAFLANGLGQLRLPTEWQLVITGLIIIAAVALDETQRRRR
ncbi:MAG: ABC transporter permease [Rubellimicrobium sp.]|nr:ABC transporter permease [Rubellimicrobium sp.]